jgi:hypothetical protein
MEKFLIMNSENAVGIVSDRFADIGKMIELYEIN